MIKRLILNEGDVIELKPDHSVYADVPKHFLYSNKQGSFELDHGVITLDKDFGYLCGEYVVYKTTFDGGSDGYGPHNGHPDGHHVFCEKVNDPKLKVDFYQTGGFTAMIQDIKPIRRAIRKWVDDEPKQPEAKP